MRYLLCACLCVVVVLSGCGGGGKTSSVITPPVPANKPLVLFEMSPMGGALPDTWNPQPVVTLSWQVTDADSITSNFESVRLGKASGESSFHWYVSAGTPRGSQHAIWIAATNAAGTTKITRWYSYY